MVKPPLAAPCLACMKRPPAALNSAVRSYPNCQRQQCRPYDRKIQLVFQDPYSSLNPRIRIGEAIGEAMLQHKLCTRAELYEKVIAVMKICGLAPQHYHRFSA